MATKLCAILARFGSKFQAFPKHFSSYHCNNKLSQMKLLLTADLHGALLGRALGDLAQSRGCTLVAVAGDLLDCFRRDLSAQRRRTVAWLRELTAQVGQVAVCSGNHDPDGLDGAGWLLRAAENLAEDRLIVDGSHAVFSDLIIAVVPYWNRYDGGEEHHQRLRASAEEVWRKGRQLADQYRLPWAVLHHEPPEGTPAAAGEDALLGAGSAWCAGWIQDCRPDYVFCGHFHLAPFTRGGSWAARIPQTGTWAFNPGRRETGCCLIELDTVARRAVWFRTWTTGTSQTCNLDANDAAPRAYSQTIPDD
jgi:Icc-related predicted phosphoesterase